MQHDPFAELGLPALTDLTDDDVRAAWRRVAAATHPDREDGGDPARFGAAAAAYAMLRTSFGRGEALADLGAGVPRGRPRRTRGTRRARRYWPPRRPWGPGTAWQLACPWYPQRRGAHRLHAAQAPARFRHAGDTGNAGDTRNAGVRPARYARVRPARYARFRPAGGAWRRRAGSASIGRGIALPASGAALAATASVAAVGWTPATIGLVAGALTVTGWGLWRRADRYR